MATGEIGPTPAEVHEARTRIARVVRHTPLEHSAWLTEIAGHDVYLKLECWQPTRSFKVRGACSAVFALSEAQRERGLITASAGNHGQAVALAARAVGAPATIFVPADAPEVKKRRIASLGAEINAESVNYDDAEAAAREYAARTGATFVHAFSDRDVVAGQGTIALEILEDLPAVRNVIVPVGGGGLIGGVGIALKAANPSIRVVGVQSTLTPNMYEALKAGRVVDCPIVPTLADGLAGQIDELSLARAQHVVDEMLLVDEVAIPEAIAALYREGVVAEGAAAVAAAAIARHVVTVDGPAVVIITGGNIDAKKLAPIIAQN